MEHEQDVDRAVAYANALLTNRLSTGRRLRLFVQLQFGGVGFFLGGAPTLFRHHIVQGFLSTTLPAALIFALGAYGARRCRRILKRIHGLLLAINDTGLCVVVEPKERRYVG
jgi:hypothetical protein